MGVELELLLVAGALLIFGFSLRTTPGRRLAGNIVVAVSVLAIAAAFVIPNLDP